MPQPLLKLIQDSETQFWLKSYNETSFGNEADALQFATDEIRDEVLAELNHDLLVARYVGMDRPPVPPKNP